ncbi:MAG: histidinol phosphate phosphatase domain-containing protein, partial [Elusimicrobiota bacterium]|nr:histidinol phosphate phosphatase domain-containing protein [Elusimicrobiota bacterium]
EITCVPPVDISKAVKQARKLGAKIVLVHGGTSLQTTPPGTNLSAILSGADIIAHPGMISEEDVKLSVENNVALEITTRKLYTSTNYHVAALAKKYNAKLVLNSDTHLSNELLTEDTVADVLKAAKLKKSDFNTMQQNAVDLLSFSREKRK